MLRSAIAALNAAGVDVIRASSIYETEPQDLHDQRWFLNMVAECQTDLFPVQLLGRLKKIEAQLGRRRTVAKGPRTIDIDILLYGRAMVHWQRQHRFCGHCGTLMHDERAGHERKCGNCGQQSRSCAEGSWSAWGACSGEGECAVGASEESSCGSDEGECHAGSRKCSCALPRRAWRRWCDTR